MGASVKAKFNITLVLGGLLALALYFPYLWFGVTPFTSDAEYSEAEIAGLLEGTDLPDFYAAAIPERTAEELATQKETFTWCRFCHTLEQGGHNRVGPNLHGIFGQPAGVVDHFDYSTAFLDKARAENWVWTPENMKAFIAAPHVMFPGNRMRYPPMIGYEMSDEKDVMIIEYLLRETR
jgi:cytochrome c